MIIREATPDDAEQMIAHVQHVSAETDSNILYMPGEFQVTIEEERAILTGYAESDNSVFLVAEVDGKIIGLLNCSGGKRRAKRHSAGLGISIAREWRKQGVGSQLMAAAIEWAKAGGIVTRIELEVLTRNTAGIGLYRKFGFVEEGRRRRAMCRDGEYFDDILMALLL